MDSGWFALVSWAWNYIDVSASNLDDYRSIGIADLGRLVRAEEVRHPLAVLPQFCLFIRIFCSIVWWAGEIHHG